MPIDQRIMSAVGFLASAYVHREQGRFNASAVDVNHAVEVMLLGKIRIALQSDEYNGRGEHAHGNVETENDQPYVRGEDFG